jgi:NADPH:quinone reductase-like Zn-dependent oxidoreductase
MRAAVCTGYGPAETVMEMRDDLPAPEPGRGEVVVHVLATSANPIDARKRAGYGRALFERARKPTFPWILGGDASGVVAAVGPSVSGVSQGDAVIGAPGPFRPGTYAERVALKASEIAPKPAALSFAEAAALPYAGLTAWSALTRTAGLRPDAGAGRVALVNGASGGVGTVAVQLLKAWGWRVAATCSADAAPLMEALGADEVIDYRADDFTERLAGLDLVFDAVGDGVEGMEARCLSVLKRPGGTYVTLVHPVVRSIDRFGLAPGGAAAAATFMRRRLAAAGRGYGWAVFKPDGEALAALAALVERRALRPVIGRVLPLERVAEAHAALERGGSRGKTVLTVDAEAAGPAPLHPALAG